MNKKYFFLTYVLLFVGLSENALFPSRVSGRSTHQYKRQPKQPIINKKILLVHVTSGFGGAEIHKIMLYRMLLEYGYNVNILIARNSPMEKILRDYKLPHHTTSATNFQSIKKLFKSSLFKKLNHLYNQQRYNIIQCYTEYEVSVAQKIRKKHPITIIFERHISNAISHDKTLNVDGIIAVSKQITESLQTKAQELGSATLITCIPGFFDYDKFLNFKTTQNKQAFFQEHFNLNLNDDPIICMIAQMHKNISTKNHPLLLKAIHTLIYEKKKPVQVLLVGNGYSSQHIKNLAHKLNLQNYVHFLGFTNKTPAILFYADMHVLSSSREALGLVNLEASLMKKPIIAATGTGAVDIIKHGYNGLLFKNNDVDDLVEKIEMLLDKPTMRGEMGMNAYKHAQENFSLEKNMKKLQQFYKKLCKS